MGAPLVEIWGPFITSARPLFKPLGATGIRVLIARLHYSSFKIKIFVAAVGKLNCPLFQIFLLFSPICLVEKMKNQLISYGRLFM